MGIYLPNMEMPKRQILAVINPNGLVEVLVGNTLIAELEAVPVPPHGRLIDADAVSLEDGPYEYDEWCKWALDRYMDAPTIIPAENTDIQEEFM